jgi:hypothetical protein
MLKESAFFDRFGKTDFKVEVIENEVEQDLPIRQRLYRSPRLRQFWKVASDGTKVLVREKEERKTSWNELFYDLIFVAAVSNVGDNLASNPAWFGHFCLMFYPIYSTWVSVQFYSNRFYAEDIFHKMLIFTQMVSRGTCLSITSVSCMLSRKL